MYSEQSAIITIHHTIKELNTANLQLSIDYIFPAYNNTFVISGSDKLEFYFLHVNASGDILMNMKPTYRGQPGMLSPTIFIYFD